MSSTNPGCLIIMIDQSASMRESLHKSKYALSWGAARFANHILGELLGYCAKGDEVFPRIMIGCYGYSGSNDVNWAIPKFNPDSDGLISISDFADCEDEIEDEENEIIIPWIVEENAYGGTPMRAAFEKVADVAERFTKNHPDSHPPIIINITGGHPTDCAIEDLPDIVSRIMNIETSDGGSLVFNIHISLDSTPSIFFPKISDTLPDVYSRYLLNASSTIPFSLEQQLAMIGGIRNDIPILDNTKCLVYKADSPMLMYAVRVIILVIMANELSLEYSLLN
jgi:hypothetical protein